MAHPEIETAAPASLAAMPLWQLRHREIPAASCPLQRSGQGIVSAQLITLEDQSLLNAFVGHLNSAADRGRESPSDLVSSKRDDNSLLFRCSEVRVGAALDLKENDFIRYRVGPEKGEAS